MKQLLGLFGFEQTRKPVQGWEYFTPRENHAAASLIQDSEASCCNLSDLLRREMLHGYIRKNNGALQIFGIDEKRHLYTHAWPQDYTGAPVPRECRTVLEQQGQIRSVMGSTRSIQTMKTLFQNRNIHQVHYILMKMPPEACAIAGTFADTPSPRTSAALVRCNLKDFRQLMPVQEQYEREEVLLVPENYNSRISGYLLKKRLREYPLFCAKEPDEHGSCRILATAGINAEGMQYAQLGTVFTRKEYRRQGLAGQVIRTVLRYLADRNRGACLFVKIRNTPAIELYRHLGFQELEPFSICYLH